MTSKEEVIQEIKGKISSYKKCLDDKNFASSDDDYHKRVRKDYNSKMILYKKILTFIKKENL